MWRWVFLIGLFCGCNSVFSPFSLNLSYPLSPSKPNPALKPLFLSPPDVVFNAEFVPAYDQAQFTKALQKATIGILQHLGYPLSPQGYNTNLQAQIGLAFKNTPKDLKDIAKMLKESHNDSLDPSRVLQMLEAKSDLTLRLCAKDTPKCLSHISVQIKQPILRANPLDSDPNERSGPNANYNHALNLALNKLFTKSMQALQNDLAGGANLYTEPIGECMLSKDVTEYSKVKSELYAYVSYLLTQNIKNYLKEPTLKYIQLAMERIKQEVRIKEDIFILDINGNLIDGEGNVKNSFAQNSLERGYFYEAIAERRCVLTNPYPTRSNRGLVVTAAYPIYNDKDELFYVVCMHIPLKVAIALSSSSKHYTTFAEGSVVMYFGISLTLALVSLLLFVKSLSSLYRALTHFSSFDVKEVFHPIVLLTLALATVDLVKAIFEEEVLGKNSGDSHHAIHRTMIRFLGSIIIALAIEALMLVFKFSISAPNKIIYAVYLAGAVSALLISLAIYVKFAYGAANESGGKN